MVALSICLWIIFAAYTESHRVPQSFQLQVFRRYNASFFKAATDVPVYLEENSAVLVIQIKATEKTEVSIPRECYISAYSHHNLLHPSLGYQLIKEYCAIRGNKVSAQPSNDRAMQFGFLIQQSFGVFNQFLFLHCTIITCQANHTNSSLASTAFRCRQSGQAGIRGRCPRKKEENITTGPFVVWPDWLKQGPETSNDVEGSERGNATREVEVRLFGNDSFQLEYKENVINIETHRKVYVEFKATDFRRVAFPSECYLSLSKTYNKGHSKDREDLIEENCEFQFGVSYRKTHNKAVRFRFIIRQSLGAIGERLYLHCNVTVCRRNDAPEPTIFNCFTHGEYCPNKTAELITKGPFVVWPFITIEERDKLKKQSSTRPRIFFPISPTGFQSFPYQGNENQNLFADSNRAFAVAGFLPLGLLLVVMTIVCYHITLMRRKAKSLVRLEPPCEEFGTQANAEELNANTTETRL